MAVAGVSANRLELLQIADAVAREKNIDKEIVIEAIEEAIQKGAKSRYGAHHDIAVEECARLSRAVSEVFDAADPISGEYLLEVSSPGVDRPLTRQSDFDLFEGYEARLETDRMIEGRKRFKGTVAGTDGDNVAMDLDGEEDTALIPFDWLVDAKLVLTDELMKAGAEKRAARNDNNEPETED